MKEKPVNETAVTLLGIVFALLFVVGVSAFFGAVFMLLWNWLLPIFWPNAPTLTFLQAWGALILINFIAALFKQSSTANSDKNK